MALSLALAIHDQHLFTSALWSQRHELLNHFTMCTSSRSLWVFWLYKQVPFPRLYPVSDANPVPLKESPTNDDVVIGWGAGKPALWCSDIGFSIWHNELSEISCLAHLHHGWLSANRATNIRELFNCAAIETVDKLLFQFSFLINWYICKKYVQISIQSLYVSEIYWIALVWIHFFFIFAHC